MNYRIPRSDTFPPPLQTRSITVTSIHPERPKPIPRSRNVLYERCAVVARRGSRRTPRNDIARRDRAAGRSGRRPVSQPSLSIGPTEIVRRTGDTMVASRTTSTHALFSRVDDPLRVLTGAVGTRESPVPPIVVVATRYSRPRCLKISRYVSLVRTRGRIYSQRGRGGVGARPS